MECKFCPLSSSGDLSYGLLVDAILLIATQFKSKAEKGKCYLFVFCMLWHSVSEPVTAQCVGFET